MEISGGFCFSCLFLSLFIQRGELNISENLYFTVFSQQFHNLSKYSIQYVGEETKVLNIIGISGLLLGKMIQWDNTTDIFHSYTNSLVIHLKP